jgi:DNA-binding MarR family transcriptional regulator
VDGLGDDDAGTLDVLVIDAVDAAHRRGSTSIADVARQLGIDRSGASRMVRDAAARGHVRKGRAPDDARRTTLELTRAGRALHAAAHAWQEQAFAQLVDTWHPDDAARFATYLRRLEAETSAAARDAGPRDRDTRESTHDAQETEEPTP